MPISCPKHEIGVLKPKKINCWKRHCCNPQTVANKRRQKGNGLAGNRIRKARQVNLYTVLFILHIYKYPIMLESF